MAELRFDDRVAVVTGAGNGLGRAHALLLGARGAKVVVNDVGGAVDGTGVDTGPAARVVAEIEEGGGQAVADTNSVATPEGGAAVITAALQAFGGVDIVVNNAGIIRDIGFHRMTAEQVTAVLDVHLGGTINVSRAAWPLLREQGYGRIVNTSSGAGLFGNFGQANYTAAKAGIVGLTRTLGIEGAKYGIRVNAIAPAAITRMTEGILGPMADKLDPGLVSPVVAWLAHEDCPATGELFHVAGGRVTRVLVGFTRGYFDRDLTPESVRDHFDAICDASDHRVPASSAEHAKELMALLQ